jgi:alpha-ketoglutarate-dependent taurine dioxygenase
LPSGKPIELSPCTGSIGAEVSGVQVGPDLSESEVKSIRSAFLSHKVLVFRRQDCSPEELLGFAALFGDTTNSHPILDSASNEMGHVLEVDYTQARLQERFSPDGRVPTTNVWHTDVSFMETPPLGTVMQVSHSAPVGGDTLYSNAEAAFESLPGPLKTLAQSLRAVHDASEQYGSRVASGGGEWDGVPFDQLKPVEHPVVRRHPVTSKPCLFVNPGFTTRLAELRPEDSREILDIFYRYLTRPEVVVRFRWESGDVAFWDNRCTMHYATRDYGNAHRAIRRVTLRGDPVDAWSPQQGK